MRSTKGCCRAWRPDADLVNDIKRLVRHWLIYPALPIWFLWNFATGSGTPLQYYLQDTLYAQDAQWGQWNAIFSASFIPSPTRQIGKVQPR
jgi:hypothetical protein